MIPDIFSILSFVLLLAATGFAYYFSATRHWSVPVRVLSAFAGFSLALIFLSFLFIGTGLPEWMGRPVEFFFTPDK